MADEGQIAGKLSILVEASLKGFKQRLEAGVEAAAKGVAAQVGIDVDEAGLRAVLEEKVKAAAKGITATIGIDVDAAQVKAKVEAAAKAAASTATINVDADTGTVVAETVAAAVAAEKAAPTITLRTRIADLSRAAIDRLRDQATSAARTAAGGWVTTFSGMVKGALVETSRLEKAVGGGGGGLRMRTLFRGSFIFGLVSLIQPAIGAIGQLVAGLTSIVGAAAPAVGVLAAIPISIAAIVQGAMAGKVAFQGMGDAMGLLAEEQAALARGEKLTTEQQEKLNQALSELSPSAIVAAKAMTGLRDDWVKVRKVVQEALFSKIADQIEPLAKKMLPLLQRELSRTAGTLGRYTSKAMEFLQTDKAQGDIGKVMKNNNVIFGDFLYMMGQFGSGAIDFLVSSRKFGRGVGDVMRDVGDWFSGKAEKGRKSGSTADFLEKASEKATQLWNITKQLGGGFAGIFRAAAPSGERLLTTFEGFVTNWNEWVNSTGGQNYLRDWFEGTEDGFIELSRLANDTFKGVAKWADDPKIAGMIKQIRTQLGPELGNLLEQVADISGEGTINFITELTELGNTLVPALEPVSKVIGFVTSALDGLNAVAKANPEATSTITKIIGLLLAFKAAKGIAKLTFKILGLGGLKTASGLLAGMFGAGGMLPGGKAGGKFSFGKLFGGASSKYGKGVQPVYVVNMGKGGGGLVGGVPDGDGPDKDGKRRGSKLTNGLKTASKVGGPLLLLGAGAVFTDRLMNGPRESDGQWARNRAAAQNAARTPQQNANNIASPPKFVGPTVSLDVLKKALGSSQQQRAQADYFSSGVQADPKPFRGRVPAPGKGKSTGLASEPVPFMRGGGASVGDPKKIAAVKKQLDALPRTVRRVGEEFIVAGRKAGQMGTKTQKSAKQTERTAKTLPPRLKKVGDEYAALGRKAQKSGNQTIKGTKGIEQAARKTATGVKKAAKVAADSFDAIPKKMQRAASQAGKQAGQIEKAVKSKTKSLPGTVRKAMDGVVKAVSSKAGPAKAASTKVGAGVKAPLSALRGPLQASGNDAMAGFAAGIRAQGAVAVAEARSIAAQVAAATRTELDIRSPSRVMAKLGKEVPAGLAVGIIKNGRRPVAAMLDVAEGIKNGAKKALQFIKDPSLLRSGDGIIGKGLINRLGMGKKEEKRFRDRLKEFLTGAFRDMISGGTEEQVRGAFKKLYSKIEKKLPNTKAGKKRLRAIKAEFRDEMRLLAENAEKRAKVQERIAAVQAKVDSLVERRDTMRESFKNAADETGNIGNIAAANGGFLSPARLIAQLKRKVAKAYEFKRLLADLRSKGLGEEAYQQLVDLGFDEGLPIARQLAKGDAAALQEITALQQELDGIAEKAADESSATFFDGGIKAGEAMLKTLKDDLAELEDLGKSMGKAFLSELEAVLGMDLGVKNGENLTPADAATGGDKGGNGGGGGDKHKWVPKSDKNRKCKTCGKNRNTSVHNNRTDGGGGQWDSDAPGAAGGQWQGNGSSARGTVMAGLQGSGSSARTEASSPDSYVVNEAPVHFAISGVPDQATAGKVINEAQWQVKKMRASGGRRRGHPKR